MRRQVGFTLVELMIVVTIIGVLAVVAGTAFRRYGTAGRNAEAMSMIGEFKTKQEAYKAEYNVYLSTDAAETTVYPTLGSCVGQVEPCPKALPARSTWTAAPLLNWANLGIAPGRQQLYCGYVAIAGSGAWGNAGAQGQAAFGNTLPSGPFYYVRAECDNNRNVTNNTTFIATSTSSAVITINENQ